jgi:hypothetical protein
MPKEILDAETLQYKKQLAEFSQLINPKQAPEIIAELKRKILERRGN